MSEKARARRGSIWGKGIRRTKVSSSGSSPKWMTDSQMWAGQSCSSCAAPSQSWSSCFDTDWMHVSPQEMSKKYVHARETDILNRSAELEDEGEGDNEEEETEGGKGNAN